MKTGNNKDYYESIEQKILTFLFKTDKCLTKWFDPIDLYIEYEDKTVIGEFKSRKFKHDQYEWILEAAKLNKIFNKVTPTQTNIKYLYINYFEKDNTILIWDLKDYFLKYNPEPIKKVMNLTTAYNFKGAGKKVEKEVYLLNHEYANFKIIYKQDESEK